MQGTRKALIIAAYILVFWMLLPGALSYAAVRLNPLMPWTLAPSPAGWGTVVVGAGFLFGGIATLFVEGKGWPISALPPPRLARSGPYRWVRHPIYVGAWLLVVGLSWAWGSAAGLLVLAPGFLVGWIIYALVEERGLERRFGADYRRYRAAVGLWPRPPWWWGVRLAFWLGWPLQRHGPRLPDGPVILVANHSCYLDPFFIMASCHRRVAFITTAEAFRKPTLARLLRWAGMIPLRRYRPDRGAVREVIAALAAHEVVGVFVETERSWTGQYGGCSPAVAALLTRYDVPVVPVGLSGAFDAGPRFSDVLRRRPVTVRYGEPLALHHQNPAEAASMVDGAIRGLIDDAKQGAVDLRGIAADKRDRVVWACPACGHEPFDSKQLHCGACGARLRLAQSGLVLENSSAKRDGALDFVGLTEASRATAARDARDGLGPCEVDLAEEATGDIAPLLARGHVALRWDGHTLSVGDEHIDAAALRSATTERADTLQLALAGRRMLQLRFSQGSAWRWQRALDEAIRGIRPTRTGGR